MHLTMSRPTPYTVPPSLHMLQRQAAVGYGVAFTADHCSSEAAGTAAAAGYTFTPTQAYGSTPQYQANYGSNSSCSYQSSPLYNADSPSAADEVRFKLCIACSPIILTLCRPRTLRLVPQCCVIHHLPRTPRLSRHPAATALLLRAIIRRARN